jgi:hypothetical protein
VSYCRHAVSSVVRRPSVVRPSVRRRSRISQKPLQILVSNFLSMIVGSFYTNAKVLVVPSTLTYILGAKNSVFEVFSVVNEANFEDLLLQIQ